MFARAMGLAVVVGLLWLVAPLAAEAEQGASLIGRWDLTLRGAQGDYPSWLEVRRSGRSTLVGSFVSQFGKRPGRFPVCGI